MPKLLDQVRAQMRVRHYSLKTERAYVGWIRRYIVFHGLRHPGEMRAAAWIVLPNKVNPVFSYCCLAQNHRGRCF